jgi:hypothetical protein
VTALALFQPGFPPAQSKLSALFAAAFSGLVLPSAPDAVADRKQKVKAARQEIDPPTVFPITSFP